MFLLYSIVSALLMRVGGERGGTPGDRGKLGHLTGRNYKYRDDKSKESQETEENLKNAKRTKKKS
jgi:hypothetical protein